MDWKSFIASMFGSFMLLAWPAALVIVFWMFKKELRELLPRARVKYGDAEAYFDRAGEKAAEIKAAEPELVEKAGEPASIPPELSVAEGALKSPRAAILDERRSLDASIRARASAVSGIKASELGFSEAVKVLLKEGVISDEVFDLLEDLRHIGAGVAHREFEPSEAEVKRYQDMARLAKLYLMTISASGRRHYSKTMKPASGGESPPPPPEVA